MKTPRIKNWGRASRGTSVRPKSNILNTTASNEGKVFINTVEDHGVSSFPNCPSNGGAYGRGFKAAAAFPEEESHASSVGAGNVQAKEGLDLPGPEAAEEQVVRVFILGA
jgi:hypothetical protein